VRALAAAVSRAAAASLAVTGLAFAQAPGTPPPPYADLLAQSPAADWRALDPESTLYFDLPAGRVVIELAPNWAPAAVTAVRKLVREGYFDAAVVLRAQDNYVVQWARPEDDPKAKAMQAVKLAPEFFRKMAGAPAFTRLSDPDTYAPEVGFSEGFPMARDPARGEAWLAHCYGAVGVGRDTGLDTGNGAELYVVIGQSPRNLDRNVTLIGRVVQGIELLSVMPRGPAPMGFYAKKEQWVAFRGVKVAADMPAGTRTNLEALRTDSATFKAVIASRAHRREAWFAEPGGRIGVCNVPLPVREARR